MPVVGGRVNLSQYKVIENDWKRAISDGKEVEVEIRLKYKSETRRPDALVVVYTIDELEKKRRISNQVPRKRGGSDGDT